MKPISAIIPKIFPTEPIGGSSSCIAQLLNPPLGIQVTYLKTLVRWYHNALSMNCQLMYSRINQGSPNQELPISELHLVFFALYLGSFDPFLRQA
jgi:hypothetical protein